MKKGCFFKNYAKIHFIGIGGASMSGLAKFCLTQGIAVSGSDKHVSNVTRRLASLGAKICIGHSAKNVADAQLVVYSSAVSADNPELVFAIKNGVPVLKRSEMLGQIMSLFNRSVGVAGSHGKTTSTAMIAEIFIAAGFNPTVFIGGEEKNFGNFRLGGKNTAVAEACEYKRNFLDISPTISVVLNIDNDHVDTYKNMDEAKRAFSLFISSGISVVNADDRFAKEIVNFNSVTFGIKNLACYSAKNVKGKDCRTFTAFAYGKRLGRIKLKVSGEHNVYNALAAIAVSDQTGVPFSVIKAALENFEGVKRRNEFIGEISDVKCYADYAHHPTEISAVLNDKNCCTLAVFQPHTYSRTAALKKEFCKALLKADGVIIYKTYSAREKYSEEGDGVRIFEELQKIKKTVWYAAKTLDLKRLLARYAKNYKRIIFIGAGDIYDRALKCVSELKNRN